MPVAARSELATATGAHIVQPSSFGPTIHLLASAVPGAAAGVDTDADGVVDGALPIVVVLVTVVWFPDTLVDADVVTPVLLLTVFVVVVLLGADAMWITSPGEALNGLPPA